MTPSSIQDCRIVAALAYLSSSGRPGGRPGRRGLAWRSGGRGTARSGARDTPCHDDPVRSTPVTEPTTVLCDLDGVVWLSGQPIAGSVEAVARLRDAGHRVLFVTNSSWPLLAEHEAALAAIGIGAVGEVVSSP